MNPELPIDEKIVLKLTGINNLPFSMMGQLEINILGYPTILNIIPNEVPIDEDVVISSEFFRENNFNINYVSKCLEIQNKLYPFESTEVSTISARTVTKFYIPIENIEKNFINLSNDDLSNKILNRFLKTEIFFANEFKFVNITGEESI